MSLESMLASLAEEAESEKKKILEEMNHQKEALRKDTELKAKDIRDTLMRKAKEAMDLEEAKTIGNAKTQGSKLLLEARRKEFERIFDQAKERMNSLSREADYPQLFFDIIQESLTGLSGKIVAEVSPQDMKLAHDAFRRLNEEVEIKPNPNMTDGVVLQTKDSRLTIKNTFDSRLSKTLNSLTIEVAHKLWPSKGSDLEVRSHG